MLSFLILLFCLQYVHAAPPYMYGLYWVVASPNEGHISSCSRFGLLATDQQITLNTTSSLWDETIYKSIITSLGYTSLSAPGCCETSFFCSNSQGVCYTTGYGGSYSNPTWTQTKASFAPVYTCRNSSSTTTLLNLSSTSVASLSQLTSGTYIRLTLSGFALPNNNNGTLHSDPHDLQIQIGEDTCKDVNICGPSCQPCNSTSPCEGSDQCVYYSALGYGFCASSCSPTKPCLCGGSCQRAPLLNQSSTFVCSISAFFYQCNSPINKLPFITSNSRSFTCQLPTIAASKLAPISVAFGGVVYRNLSQINVTGPGCSSTLQCDDGDICTLDTCNPNGSCSHVPTPLCTSVSTLYTNSFIGETFVPVLESRMASNFTYDINMAAASVSTSALYDDWPPAPSTGLSAVSLTFPFTLYGQLRNQFYISPNGALLFDNFPPCGNSFATGTCDTQDYQGFIAPYLADLDPPIHPEISSILYAPATDNKSFYVLWKDVGYYVQNPNSSDPLMSFAVQLNSDNSLTFHYYRMFDIPDNTLWLAGAKSLLFSMQKGSSYITSDFLQSGNVVTLCTMGSNLACLSPACGNEGTPVSVTFGPLYCGQSIQMIAYYCMFSTTYVLGTVLQTSSQSSSITLNCVAPSMFDYNVTSSNVTIPVRIFAQLNNTRSGSLVELDVVAQSVIYLNGTPVMNKHPLLFTYTNSSLSCGCLNDALVNRVCNASLICSNAPIAFDCNGDVNGNAAVDDCGVCTGGNTGSVPNFNKNCRGVCYGSNYGCGSSSTTSSQVTTTTKAAPPSTSSNPAIQSGNGYVGVLLGAFFGSVIGLLGIFGSCVKLARKLIASRSLFQEVDFDVQSFNRNPRSPRVEENEMSKLPISIADEKTAKGDCCSICLTEFEVGQEVRILPSCQHTFHAECVTSWFKVSVLCPLCKDDVRSPTNKRKRRKTKTGSIRSGAPNPPASAPGINNVILENDNRSAVGMGLEMTDLPSGIVNPLTVPPLVTAAEPSSSPTSHTVVDV